MALDSDEIVPGDIVAVHHEYGRREGLVIGSYTDYANRLVIAVRLDNNEVYNAWYPTVTRVKRTISVARPFPNRQRTTERLIYW